MSWFLCSWNTCKSSYAAHFQVLVERCILKWHWPDVKIRSKIFFKLDMSLTTLYCKIFSLQLAWPSCWGNRAVLHLSTMPWVYVPAEMLDLCPREWLSTHHRRKSKPTWKRACISFRFALWWHVSSAASYHSNLCVSESLVLREFGTTRNQMLHG